ncbi:F-box protein At5g07610-like [Pistacia vera]|uniref:F-box protein At5g07610-like n=1 Tax=Pistacia vera TaxID=55513 RepID=UPI0012631A84|nr:F-box protein At5g07610-like [Pistacia vera]
MLSAQRIKLETSITIIPSSAEEIANNDDLLIELLIRLPFKSLLIFNSESKHWLSLISDPDFSDRSLIPRPISGRFLCNIDRSEYDFIILNSSSSRNPLQLLTLGDDSSKIMVLHSCIGLLLCCSLKVKEFSPYLNLKYFDNYHVFNPTAKQYTMLPPIRARTRVFRAILGIFLAFDPSKSPHCKAIYVRSICDSLENTRFEMLIYSSKTGGWQHSGNTFVGPFSLNAGGGVFWNGAVHWINFRLKSLYLDIEEEKVGEMPMPPTPDGFAHRSFSYFGESRGH